MKLWGGRFKKQPSIDVDKFQGSISFDSRLYKQDIIGSIAHSEVLYKAGIITSKEKEAIVNALQQIMTDIEEGRVEFDQRFEDIHMNIEKLLTERIGDAGKKLHTARSRNDQVALDLRLYLVEEIKSLQKLINNLLDILCEKAENNLFTLMPGFTHLQPAQPVSLAHHFMAYFEMFKRDYRRLEDCLERTSQNPLGSCALAGTTLSIDRNISTDLLGFKGYTLNSMDAVSDRDFVIEFQSVSAIIMMHLSRFCEELVLWSSEEFKWIEMDDSYSTGSSIMPQKKNPDVAELIRGKTGRVYGNLVAILTVMKALPLAYNKDMQEDKEGLFDTVDTLKNCLIIFTGMFSEIKFNKGRMENAVKRGFLTATDITDYLVEKGVPFRTAHEIVGRLVLYCCENNILFEELTREEINKVSPLLKDYLIKLDPLESIKDRNIPGGPAPEQVREHIRVSRQFLDKIKNDFVD